MSRRKRKQLKQILMWAQHIKPEQVYAKIHLAFPFIVLYFLFALILIFNFISSWIILSPIFAKKVFEPNLISHLLLSIFKSAFPSSVLPVCENLAIKEISFVLKQKVMRGMKPLPGPLQRWGGLRGSKKELLLQILLFWLKIELSKIQKNKWVKFLKTISAHGAPYY